MPARWALRRFTTRREPFRDRSRLRRPLAVRIRQRRRDAWATPSEDLTPAGAAVFLFLTRKMERLRAGRAELRRFWRWIIRRSPRRRLARFTKDWRWLRTGAAVFCWRPIFARARSRFTTRRLSRRWRWGLERSTIRRRRRCPRVRTRRDTHRLAFTS